MKDQALPDHHEIKRISLLSDFTHVFKVFENPPYNEIWWDWQIKKEFDLINANGVAFGYYIEGNCVGLVAIRNPLLGEHPFEYIAPVLFLSDLCVLHDYRKQAVAKRLLQHALKYSKDTGASFVYLRTLSDQCSCEFEVFKSEGFLTIPDVCQEISRPRYRGPKEDLRIFMEMKL